MPNIDLGILKCICFIYVNVTCVSIVFGIDCIHREFSAKGEMRCPNCRNVETSQWHSPNSPRPSNELNRGDVMSQHIYPDAVSFINLLSCWLLPY
ncbi:putative transcription factor C2C2-GATA family [Helianthus anomalus]